MMLTRKILALAWPNVLTNITIPLLTSFDLGLMGRMGNPVFTGAVALGSMLFAFLFWIFGFLRMSSSGLAAIAHGRQDVGSSRQVLLRSGAIALALGLLLIALQYPLQQVAFALLHGSSEVKALAASYFSIRIYAAPATLLLYVFTGWFIGNQQARYPMLLIIGMNLLNIALSLIFIRLLGWGVRGVAWANLISQYSGAVAGWVLLIYKFPHVLKSISFRQDLAIGGMGHFFHINANIFIRTLCLIATLTFFTARSAGMGDPVLAANTLLFQFFYFFSYLADGFAFAAEAIVGSAMGAGNRILFIQAIRKFLWLGGVMAALFSLMYGIAGKWILSILSHDNSVLLLAGKYMFWAILLPWTAFAAFIWDGIFVGATASREMRNNMLLSAIVVFFPSFLLLQPLFGNHALWLAFLMFMASRSLGLWWQFRRHGPQWFGGSTAPISIHDDQFGKAQQ